MSSAGEEIDCSDNKLQSDALSKSALQDNIERKGANAYYFAHKHKATGPAWDGKVEPRLLGRHPSSVGSGGEENDESPSTERKVASFEYHKSNITNYAFLDEAKKVKLYVDLEGVAESCPNDDDVTLSHTPSSLCLLVKNYASPNEGADGKKADRCLSFGRLHGQIESASFRKKKDRIVITLVKTEEKQWPTINAKGSPDHELL